MGVELRVRDGSDSIIHWSGRQDGVGSWDGEGGKRLSGEAGGLEDVAAPLGGEALSQEEGPTRLERGEAVAISNPVYGI